MEPDINDFTKLLDLEQESSDTYIGLSPTYPWGRVYGGQVVAQGLRAAANTVESNRFVHSLHAFFIRAGNSDEPIRYEVDRIRDGKSFTTRRVVAHQSGGAILSLSCSFQITENQVNLQESFLPEDAGSPNDFPVKNWTPMIERRPCPNNLGRSSLWLRIANPLKSEPIDHACALAFTSDDSPTESIISSHPRIVDMQDDWDNYQDLFFGASLDHSIWFHRPAPADDWQFHDFQSHGLNGGRGLSIGKIFSADGIHIATVVQEVLLREKSL